MFMPRLRMSAGIIDQAGVERWLRGKQRFTDDRGGAGHLRIMLITQSEVKQPTAVHRKHVA
jgi:hypothetical protein